MPPRSKFWSGARRLPPAPHHAPGAIRQDRSLRRWRFRVDACDVSEVAHAETGRALFARARPESYRVAYGPLAMDAILMVWTWVVAVVSLAGGQPAMFSRVVVFEGPPAASCRPWQTRA